MRRDLAKYNKPTTPKRTPAAQNWVARPNTNWTSGASHGPGTSDSTEARGLHTKPINTSTAKAMTEFSAPAANAAFASFTAKGHFFHRATPVEIYNRSNAATIGIHATRRYPSNRRGTPDWLHPHCLSGCEEAVPGDNGYAA